MKKITNCLDEKIFLSKCRTVLEGILYYLGYNDIYYPRKNGVIEGSIAQEFNKLLYAKCKTPEYSIISEYTTINNKRFDTVILEKKYKKIKGKQKLAKTEPVDVKYIIETKRGTSGMELLLSDIRKLSEAKQIYKNAKTYFLLSFEDSLNSKFIKKRDKKNGTVILYNPKSDTAYKGIQEIEGIRFSAKICTHIFKSAKSIKNIKENKNIKGRFAFLIEIV